MWESLSHRNIWQCLPIDGELSCCQRGEIWFLEWGGIEICLRLSSNMWSFTVHKLFCRMWVFLEYPRKTVKGKKYTARNDFTNHSSNLYIWSRRITSSSSLLGVHGKLWQARQNKSKANSLILVEESQRQNLQILEIHYPKFGWFWFIVIVVISVYTGQTTWFDT